MVRPAAGVDHSPWHAVVQSVPPRSSQTGEVSFHEGDAALKIIAIDNFDRESVADLLVADNVHENYANEIADFLQQRYGGNYAPRFYKVVDDDHKLWGGMADLV